MSTSHTAQALEIRKTTGWNLDTYAELREWTGVGVGPVGIHRESDSLESSNWQVVFNDLLNLFGGDVDTARFGHWAVGWVEEITWNAGNPAVAERVREWQDRLENYPVADDDHYSMTEWADNHPADGECYSDDPECCSDSDE